MVPAYPGHCREVAGILLSGPRIYVAFNAYDESHVVIPPVLGLKIPAGREVHGLQVARDSAGVAGRMFVTAALGLEGSGLEGEGWVVALVLFGCGDCWIGGVQAARTTHATPMQATVCAIRPRLANS